jgi:carbon monoxide dehydrogenase subunit G
MKLLASETVTINTSAQNIFDFMVNMENFKHWFPGVIAIESANDLPHGVVGKLYLETVKVPFKSKPKKIKLQLVESESPLSFATQGTFPPLMPRMEVRLTSVDAATTKVYWQMFSRNDSLLFKVMILPLIKSVITKRARLGIEKLKKVIEAEQQ